MRIDSVCRFYESANGSRKPSGGVSRAAVERLIRMENVLYYGDNLDILTRYVRDESIDLIYLDPPFKSDQNYNVLFKEQDGTRAASQLQAFDDTAETHESDVVCQVV